MRGMREIFSKIPVYLFEDFGEFYYFNISGNVEEDSEECSRRFRGMLKKIPANLKKVPGIVQEDSGECSKRFREC